MANFTTKNEIVIKNSDGWSWHIADHPDSSDYISLTLIQNVDSVAVHEKQIHNPQDFIMTKQEAILVAKAMLKLVSYG